MNSGSTNQVLNRLVAVHGRSLPVYLRYAAPWSESRNGAAAEVITAIADDQESYANRFAEMVVQAGGTVNQGRFPLSFTALNDLAADYLIGQMIDHQQRQIEAIQQCVGQLADNPMAQTAAEEALGAAKAHLDSLRELTGDAAQ